MKSTTLTLTFLMTLPMLVVAQQSRLKYANDQFEHMSFSYAAEAYEDVLDRGLDSTIVAGNLAECYYKTARISKAAEWYRYLNEVDTLKPAQLIRLGLIERQVGNYGASERFFKHYEEKYGANDITKAYKNVESDYFERLMKDNGSFQLVDQSVNSDYSEIGVSFYNDQSVLFASNKRIKSFAKREHSWTGDGFYHLYTADIDETGHLLKAKELLLKKDRIKYNNGPASFDAKNNYLYFSQNLAPESKKKGNKKFHLKISRAIISNGKIVKAAPISINGDYFSNTHPCITSDGKKLFFASDRPGGYGGMDLYYVLLDDDGEVIGDPINMGDKVNTSQNELFPSFNESENLLFFASDGHPGLGGLDVYVAKMNNSGVPYGIDNLGTPINSNRDDFSFVSNDDQTFGYFASNRSLKDGTDQNDNIWSFKQIAPIRNGVTLKGNVFDLVSGDILEGTTVTIIDKNGSRLDSTKTDAQGNYELKAKAIKDHNLRLQFYKKGYFTDEKNIKHAENQRVYENNSGLMPALDYRFVGVVVDSVTYLPLEGVNVIIRDNILQDTLSTVLTDPSGVFVSEAIPYELEDSIDFVIKLDKEGYLMKEMEIAEKRLTKDVMGAFGEVGMFPIETDTFNLANYIHLNPIYFDLGKWDIREDASIELNKVVDFMLRHKDIVINLESHTDSRGSYNSNMWLSQKRAKSSADYIISQGISSDRITGRGFGESQLKVSDKEIVQAKSNQEKERLHQKNRRTEFIVVKMK